MDKIDNSFFRERDTATQISMLKDKINEIIDLCNSLELSMKPVAVVASDYDQLMQEARQETKAVEEEVEQEETKIVSPEKTSRKKTNKGDK